MLVAMLDPYADAEGLQALAKPACRCSPWS